MLDVWLGTPLVIVCGAFCTLSSSVAPTVDPLWCSWVHLLGGCKPPNYGKCQFFLSFQFFVRQRHDSACQFIFRYLAI
ncbi:hypothetical protein FB451DRAFT_1283436 [Mycena latifolia]|nr:hypothetical protein FB451DRAFT_1283436 [Mycena latifolia]